MGRAVYPHPVSGRGSFDVNNVRLSLLPISTLTKIGSASGGCSSWSSQAISLQSHCYPLHDLIWCLLIPSGVSWLFHMVSSDPTCCQLTLPDAADLGTLCTLHLSTLFSFINPQCVNSYTKIICNDPLP